MVISAQSTAASDPPPPMKPAIATTPPPSAVRPWNLRARDNYGLSKEWRRRRKAFSVTLTGDEIAEDFYAVTGALPRRRPKKRPRAVQKHVEMVFPGSWLKEITEELYKVPHSS